MSLSNSQAVVLIARREITQRLRDKAFFFSTVFTALVILAIVLVPQVVGGDGDASRLGVTGAASRRLAEALGALPQSAPVKVETTSFPNEGQATAAVKDGDVDAALIDGRLVVESEPPEELVAVIQAVEQRLRAQSLVRTGKVAEDELQAALDPEPISVRALDPQDPQEEQLITIAAVGVLLLYLQVITYGYWISMGIAEEKSSRVVEVLLPRRGRRR